jgi:hypothetical protein
MTVVKRKPVGRPKKRVSTREPKTIIKRKPAASRKPAAAKPKVDREAAAKAKLAEDHKLQTEVVALMKKGATIPEVAEKLDIPRARAKRLWLTGSVKATDRIVGTDAEVGKVIAKLRDVEGVPWPQIRARTGLGGAKIRHLYEEATNKSWKESGLKKEAKPKAPAKRTAKAPVSKTERRTARAERVKKIGAKKTTSAGRPKGPRARRERNKQLLTDVIWNLDVMDLESMKDALEERTIDISRTVNDRPMKPISHKVLKVKSVTPHDREGKVIEYVDEDQRVRFCAAKEITNLR